jgi:hypothetical protein
VIVQSEQGTTGIDKITMRLSKMMREELSERVETVYDDVFWIPLLAAILLLINDAFIFDTPWQKPWTVGKILLAVLATFGALSFIVLAVDVWREWSKRKPKRGGARA